MNPRFFGESRDIAKRQIMQWLAPGERWAVHPMWFSDRPESPSDRAFLDGYATALNANIVDGESRNVNELFAAAQHCGDHLLLDPDTGMSQPANGGLTTKHVRVDQLIRIAMSPIRQDKLTLVYDQSFSFKDDYERRIGTKLDRLCNASVHSAAYLAEPVLKVCFVWASANFGVLTKATRMMQKESGFPCNRFLGDGCGHVDNN